MSAMPNNLPIQLSSFIGREREIVEVQRLLTSSRLVTLTGAGGCGKTRLALQVAADRLAEFADGVWLVELAPLSDPALVLHTTAKALGVSEQPGRALTNTLLDFLREKALLLVLDNCEHLIDACAQMGETLLQGCPALHVLATSREALNIAGERVWIVPSLQLPTSNVQPPISNLHQYDAVRLFVERASAVQADFKLTNQNAAAVVQICQRLDGIPLAIELAAARVKVLSVAQITARLDDALRLLTEGKRTALLRHQTLRATMDWSYDLLSTREQILFRRLSLFAGSFALDAAAVVCTDDELQRDDVLSVLAHLVDKSLVVKQERDGMARYRLLEPIRQYAADKLRESGEVEPLHERHLNYFSELAETVEPKLHGPEQISWFNRLEHEHDNLRVALVWASTHRKSDDAHSDSQTSETGLRLAAALWWFWIRRGHLSEGREWLMTVLAGATNTPASHHAKALYRAGFILWCQQDANRARALCEQSLALCQSLADRRGIAFSLNIVGGVLRDEGQYEQATPYFEQSFRLWRDVEDQWGMAWTYLWLAPISTHEGDLVSAEALYRESLTLFRSLGDIWGIAESLFHLGGLAGSRGNFAQATALLEESVSLHRAFGNTIGIWRCQLELGLVASGQGEFRKAEGLLTDSIAAMRDLGLSIVRPLISLGQVARHQGDYLRATELLDEALRLCRQREGHGPGHFAACLAVWAGVACALKRFEPAARLFGAAEALLDSTGAVFWTSVRGDCERDLATVRKALGEAAFAAARVEGRTLTLEQICADTQQLHSIQIQHASSPPGSLTRGPNVLTARELDVLRLVAAGLSAAQIAEQLVISRRTVQTHLTAIYTKFNVNSRSAATRHALHHKLL